MQAATAPPGPALLSLQGTIRRVPYLLCQLLLCLASVLGLAAGIAIIIGWPDEQTTAVGVFALFTVPAYAMQTVLAVQRLRDAAIAGYWVLLGPLFFLLVLGVAVFYSYGALFTEYIPLPREVGEDLAVVNAMIVGTGLAAAAPLANQLVYLCFALLPTRRPAAEETEEEQEVACGNGGATML